MGQHLAKLVLLSMPLGGCSLLYDPDRLPAAADAMILPPDIFPCQMEVSDLAPVTIVEGMGDGGSRPAVLVISGKNLIAQGSSVMITPAAGSTRPLRITTDDAKIEIGAHGEQLLLPITLPVDPDLTANEMIDLDVKVEQDCPDGRVSGMIAGKLKLRGLAELTSAADPLVGGLREYSQINVETGTLVFATPTPTTPIILRSTSSVKIANTISLNAGRGTDVKLAGPAGGNGGTGGNGLGGVGTPGAGPLPGLSSGAPGGFSSSDPGLNTLNNPNRSSGGAGGDGALLQPKVMRFVLDKLRFVGIGNIRDIQPELARTRMTFAIKGCSTRRSAVTGICVPASPESPERIGLWTFLATHPRKSP
jgi:hypothetical protein